MKLHYESTNHVKHALCINLSTTQIWCYLCDDEVIEQTQNETVADTISAIRLLTDVSRGNARPATKKNTQGREKYTGLAGLANLGNTCYMNAALQCLANTTPLTWYFQTNIPATKLNAPLVQHYAELVTDIWSGEYSEIAPVAVVRDIKRMNPIFQGYGQQDSQEFLRCILDKLHEHLKEECAPPYADDDEEAKPSEQKQQEEEEEEEQRKEPKQTEPEPTRQRFESKEASGLDDAWGGSPAKYKVTEPPTKKRAVDATPRDHKETNGVSHERQQFNKEAMVEPPSPTPKKKAKIKRRFYQSIVSDCFEGLLLSRVKCLKCGYISSKKDPFWDLSLSIPDNDTIRKANEDSGHVPSKAESNGWGSWLGSFFTSRTVDLADCMRAFCMKEELTGSERYRCDRCKLRNDSQKYMRIIRPPEVLCVHIKRFRHDAYLWTKSTDRVLFPLKGFDIGAFCEPYQQFASECEHTKYDLIGVVRHMGIMSGGHYIAYAYNQKHKQWYEFDDRTVSSVSPSTVENTEGYVLFYRRKIPEREEERKQIKRQVKEYAQQGHKAEGGVYYLSRKWWARWKVVHAPGPIDNQPFVCHHGRMLPKPTPPTKSSSKTGTTTATSTATDKELIAVPPAVWKYLCEKYGGGPPLRSLITCDICAVEHSNLEVLLQPHICVLYTSMYISVFTIYLQLFTHHRNVASRR
eukprot:TRINITY_DN2392_c1_g1_i1.p1 TRINITY_DN2392_c1_g1~~TRINITY_DN2392_c1_g1_i1.p1  ORF type:complete len:770 (-),score=109.17 TRINITY_DN2392_c1_g1_i1:552-2624(-)